MKKILIAGLVAFALVAITGMASASNVQFITNVNGNGVISVDNYGHKNVVFVNDLRVGSGTINFDQDIYTGYGHFSNDVRLHGTDLRLNNNVGEQYVAGHWSGTGAGWVKSHREVAFGQKIYTGESSTNWDEARSTQSFSFNGKYIAQKVQVNPTNNPGQEVESDTLNMWSGDYGQGGVMNDKFMKTVFGGRATLSQEGKMHADYDFAKQWTNMNSGAGSSIVSYNNVDWIHFEQMLTLS